jgi:hypothetical protein
MRRAVALASVAAALFGCGVARAPIDTTPSVVATPAQGQLSISVAAKHSVGSVTPVYVSIANGTDFPRAVVPDQIFALNSAGERIAPIPAGEAARQAGNAGELRAALTSAAVSGVGASAVGAGLGAAVGSAFGAAGTGAIVGSGYGGAYGLVEGARAGQSRSDQQAASQIHSLAMQPADVRKNFTVSGYVFFPKGIYSQVEVLLVDRETGDTEDFRQVWR